MENALFYTFSTIAQTLAAAIALLGAFALYRLQTIRAVLDDLAGTAMQPYLPDETARKLQAEGAYIALLDHLSNTQPRNPKEANEPRQVATRNTLRAHVETMSFIRRSLTWALGLTGAAIVGAVTVLAFTPRIAVQPTITCAVFVVGIALFATCIVLYAMLVVRSLR
jgi:hypothetical protein